MMKEKIIAIWGATGTGKSTLSGALAQRLSKEIDTVLVVNADPYVKAFTIWGVDADNLPSIGETLNHPELTQKYIRSRTTALPGNDKIGLIGYLPKDNIERFDPISLGAAKTFLSQVRDFSEITIIDCCLPSADMLSYSALLEADIIVSLIEPNCRGVGFYFSMASMFEHFKNLQLQKHILVAAKYRSESPIEQVENDIGQAFDVNLPYTTEAMDRMDERNLFVKYGEPFQHAVNQIANEILFADIHAEKEAEQDA